MKKIIPLVLASIGLGANAQSIEDYVIFKTDNVSPMILQLEDEKKVTNYSNNTHLVRGYDVDKDGDVENILLHANKVSNTYADKSVVNGMYGVGYVLFENTPDTIEAQEKFLNNATHANTEVEILEDLPKNVWADLETLMWTAPKLSYNTINFDDFEIKKIHVPGYFQFIDPENIDENSNEVISSQDVDGDGKIDLLTYSPVITVTTPEGKEFTLNNTEYVFIRKGVNYTQDQKQYIDEALTIAANTFEDNQWYDAYVKKTLKENYQFDGVNPASEVDTLDVPTDVLESIVQYEGARK